MEPARKDQPVPTGAAAPRREKAPIGLRTVAVFEIAKGLLFLLFALAARSLIHKDVEDWVADVLRDLHLDPAWHYSRVLLDAASNLTPEKLHILSVVAFVLSGIRLAEGYGLWLGYAWAEWFAVVSAGVYLPLEVIRYAKHPALGGAVIFIVNIVIVVYLARLLAERHRRKKLARANRELK